MIVARAGRGLLASDSRVGPRLWDLFQGDMGGMLGLILGVYIYIWVVVKILVPLCARCRILLRTQKGTTILTTPHMDCVRGTQVWV